MEQSDNANIRIPFIITVLLVALNFIFFRNHIVVQIFAIFYLFVAYKMFAYDMKSFLYYTTLIFALINFSLLFQIKGRYDIYYFYVSLLIYMILYFKNNLKDIIHRFSIARLNKYSIFFIVFIVYMFLSFFIAGDKRLAVKSIINYCIMFCLVFMLVNENRNMISIKNTLKFLQYIYTAILGLGTLEIFGIRYGLRNHYFELGITPKEYPFVERIPVSFFYNPNDYAVFLIIAMSMIMVAYVFIENGASIKRKVYLLILYIISQVNLIFTTSRTCWVTIFISILFVYIALIISRKKGMLKRITAVFLLTAITFMVVSFFPGMDDYYGKFNNTPILRMFNLKILDNVARKKIPIRHDKLIYLSEGGSTNERATLIYDVIDGVIFKKHFMGFGTGNIINYITLKNNTHGVLNVHSLWFEIMGDFGIFIFLYVIYMYVRMLIDLLIMYMRNFQNGEQYILMILLSSFVFIFLAFAPSTVVAYTPFWLLLGISFSITLMKYRGNV